MSATASHDHQLEHVNHDDVADIVFDVTAGNAAGLREKLLARPQAMNGRIVRNGISGQTLLHLATSGRVVEIIAEAARECGVSLNLEERAIAGSSPLIQALRGGYLDAADALLRLGASVECAATHLPISAAIGKSWSAQAINMLVRAGAHPDGPDHGSRSRLLKHVETPLFKAAWTGDSDAALALLAAGADGQRVVNGVTAMQAAADFDRPHTAGAIRAWLHANQARDALRAVAAASARLSATFVHPGAA